MTSSPGRPDPKVTNLVTRKLAFLLHALVKPLPQAMKTFKPLTDPFAPVQKATPRDRLDPLARRLSPGDFAKGVEVVEVLDTMPADLWELFNPKPESP
jgi:hypothetical protein